ncbi:NUDIX domain-containing protein [Gynuella sunshinyii]|uniref:ADP-ribose pyrophosphatase n=1 Tax=Gynuella sunshinyii YC6258 TaxID=1445510 RepID=A0A0C5VC42_9GAMM|nr:NUDIX domain-containing protein [Gynuella sunshinyii]AJQ92082.1 ADP-ribose pyrophosphatase [Gynuella sunshinyii YC6258]
MRHRIRAAGIAIQNDCVLLVKHIQHGETWWVPPGGGYESQDQCTQNTVKREFFEEAGLTDVTVGPLMFVREFIEDRANVFHLELFYSVTGWHGDIHLNNLAGLGGDELLIQETSWVPRHQLDDMVVYPAEIRSDIWQQPHPTLARHLGTFHELDGYER